MNPRPPALIALSPGDLDERSTKPFLRTIHACADSGLRGILLREPALSDRATLALAIELRRIFEHHWFALHDRVHLAEACHADAVHLGFRSLAPPVAREILPPHIAIGFSAHARDDLQTLAACDYLFFGPIFDTPSKRDLQEPVGFPGLARAVMRTSTPIWAIGGLQPEHMPELDSTGAAGAAILGGVLHSPDPPTAVLRYLQAMTSHT